MAFFLCLSSRNYTAAIILQISDGLTDTKSYKEIPDAGTSEALFIIAAGLVISLNLPDHPIKVTLK